MGIKFQGLAFANHISIPKSATSTTKLAPKITYVKITYAEKVKSSPSITVTKDKKHEPPKKVITTLKSKLLNTKTS